MHKMQKHLLIFMRLLPNFYLTREGRYGIFIDTKIMKKIGKNMHKMQKN